MAHASRSEASPLDERFNLDSLILGIADDLAALRAGTISVEDVRVRAELAKQAMNGVRLVINAQKYLETRSRLVPQNGSALSNPSPQEGL